MAPGVSHTLAIWRATRVGDVRYALTLAVGAQDTATGHIRIAFTRHGSDDVILDYRGPRLMNPHANGAPLAGMVNNGAHLRLPGTALRAGANVLDFDFVARVAPAGASIIRFHDATDGADYLYTLLVPSDANQLFPCFDQPDIKARVTLTLSVPRGWTAVANGPVVRADRSAGETTFHFAQTRPISTYLIAFAAGPWATVTRHVDGRTVTMYVRRSRAREAQGDSLIAANARAARWYARYFGIPYPWPKLDFVLAPAFPFGGMEHPGAIFYNEDSFIFRERPTRPQLLGREATIYHEVAHQWFGDLVTMRWFDDLWLKEGFATYMAAKMQAALEPASHAWETFYLRNKPAAYAVDQTAGTTPIWQSLANLDQAKSNYGAIVYNKAPGVLKQLNTVVGDVAFRRGLHDYLSAHAFGNATWRDLLDAVGHAAGRSLTAWGEQYILRPGMPVVTQHVHVRGGRITDLVLSQHPASALSGHGPWPIQTTLLLGYPSGRNVELPLRITGEITHVTAAAGRAAPAWVFANAKDQAYALTLVDPASATWLSANVGTIRDPLQRAMAWDALWELVRRTQLAPARFLTIAEHELPAERDDQITTAVLGHVVRAARAYLLPAQQTTELPAVEAMLRAGAADTSRHYGVRKTQLDALVRVATTPATLRLLARSLDSTRLEGLALAPPVRWAIVGRLLAAGWPGAGELYAAEVRRDTTSDGRRQAFIAGAARPDPSVKATYFQRYLSDSTLNEDWATASLGAFNSLEAQQLTLRYLRPALDTLPWLQRHRRIFFVGAWLNAFLDGQTSPAALQVVHAFLRERVALPEDLRQKTLQAVAELERTVAIRARERESARGAGRSP